MKKHNKILIVDDNTRNIQVIANILSSDSCEIEYCMSGMDAIDLTKKQNFDIILMDVMMPGIDGYETCRQILLNKPDALIIFVTSLNDDASITNAYKAGAVDYITKPVKESEVMARVFTHLELDHHRKNLNKENKILEFHVAEKTKEILDIQKTTIITLATLAELRDNETGAHVIRTQNYVRVLAYYLLENNNQDSKLNKKDVELIIESAPLHDLGKIGIRDSILLKPGKLTDEEFEIMKTHAALGKAAFDKAESSHGSNTFLKFAQEIAYTHHEKWDGSGYPNGLAGKDIPISGRIMAVADVYDALISRRCYKPPFPHKKAYEIIKESSGSHFDPQIVDAFIATEILFKQIALENADSQEEKESLG